MDTSEQGYQALIERVAGWAQAACGIRAAIVVGSRARTDHPADPWSDLDVLLLTRDDPGLAGLRSYIHQAEWLTEIGTPWLTFVEPAGDGEVLERRVLFAGGFDVDFAVLPVARAQQLLGPGEPSAVRDVFRRGARVLVDKDDWAGRILSAAREPAPPSLPIAESAFQNAVSDFWYHAVWTAKHLRRGELWWAKEGCDGHLKYLLRQMLEWQAHATHGASHDTWLRGRFLEEWADPRAVATLPGVFAHYDVQDVWHALEATMDLFRWTSLEAAERLNFAYPTVGAEHATQLVRQMQAEIAPRG